MRIFMVPAGASCPAMLLRWAWSWASATRRASSRRKFRRWSVGCSGGRPPPGQREPQHQRRTLARDGHAFGRGDSLDQGDCFFGSRSNRAALENMLENGCASPGFTAALRYGNPLALVEIYRSASGGHYINVVLAQ